MKFLAIFLSSVCFFGIINAENTENKSNIVVEKKLENGKTLSLMKLDPTKDIFSFKLSGFNPKENVTITSSSCDESVILKMITNDAGELITSIDPKIGKNIGGKGSLEVKTKDNETLLVDFDWGQIR